MSDPIATRRTRIEKAHKDAAAAIRDMRRLERETPVADLAEPSVTCQTPSTAQHKSDQRKV